MTAKPISGVMPRWQKNSHRLRFALMCFLFGGIGLFQLYSIPLARGARAAKGLLFITLMWFLIAAIAIGMQLWVRRRLVEEFSYDGRGLRFRTLGRPEMQLRDVAEIAGLEEWRGHGHPLGYRFRFRDGEKAYLQHSVSNSAELAEQVYLDLQLHA